MKRIAHILITILLCICPVAHAQSERNAIVIPVQFPDLKFSHGTEEFTALCDSLKLYFDAQFHGNTIFRFDLAPIVTLQEDFAHYGENSTASKDALMYKGVIDACKEVDDDIDFAQYSNGNSTVNDILILVPGISEADGASTEYFWPQYISLVEKDAYLYLDKKRIDHYALSTELDRNGNFSGIGNFAHEYSHVLGLNDLYDTDGEGSGGLSFGLWGSTALMDKGNTNVDGHLPPNYNAVDLYVLGIGNGVSINQTGAYTLEPIDVNGDYYIIQSDVEGEVFLLECRKEEGYDAAIGGSGLLVYHVDRSENDCGWSDYYKMNLSAAQRWSYNQVNCNPEYECASLLPAIHDTTDISRIFFPQEGHNSLGDETIPALQWRDGTSPSLAISGISIDESGTVSFNVIRPIEITNVDLFQSSAIISWKVDSTLTDVQGCKVFCISGSDTLSISESASDNGRDFTGIVEKLSPNTNYKFIIKVYTTAGNYSFTLNLKTRPYRNKVYPFIFLRPSARNADGSFIAGTRIPLQVFNAPDAEQLRWYFNGTSISAGTDGYYELTRSGELKVEVLWKDGSTDIITKEITVK